MEDGSSFRFNQAIVRAPGNSVASGLRALDGRDPDPVRFREEHRGYVAALVRAGVTVTELDALESFPDSVFVEDAALCIGGLALSLRPGAPSRAGEPEMLLPEVASVGLIPVELGGVGHVDGGDILVTDTDVFVGLSARTDPDGMAAVAAVVEPLGYTLREVKTPDSILHFKTDCGLLDSTTVFATENLAATGCFDGYDLVVTPKGEEAAANLIRVNNMVFVAEGFPETAELLTQRGYLVETLAVYEAAKVDGGLSCMSLRFSLDRQ